MRLKVSSAKRRPFCLGLNELILDAYDKYNIFRGYIIHYLFFLRQCLWGNREGHDSDVTMGTRVSQITGDLIVLTSCLV